MGTKLDSAVKYSQITSVVAQIAIAALAGWWTYHWYSISEQSNENPAMNISTEVYPYSGKNSLVTIHVILSNAGKVPVKIDKGSLTVTINELPSDLKTNLFVDPASGRPTLKSDNLLSKDDGGIEIPPTDEGIDEDQLVALPPGIYFIKAELAWKKNGDTLYIDDSAIVNLK